MVSYVRILYIIFNMATSNINKKVRSCHWVKKKNFFNLGNVIDIARALPYFWKSLLFLSAGCNNEKKLKVTLKF